MIMVEINIGSHVYAIEFSDGWVHLTRCLTECIGCCYYAECKEWNENPTYTDCTYEAVGNVGLPLSNTYDFDTEITQRDYPEFTADEIVYLNGIITNHVWV